MKYAFVRAQAKEFAVKRMCRVLKIAAAATMTGEFARSPSAVGEIGFCLKKSVRSIRR